MRTQRIYTATKMVHYVNGDPLDNRLANVIPLCRDCHHKATFPGI